MMKNHELAGTTGEQAGEAWDALREMGKKGPLVESVPVDDGEKQETAAEKEERISQAEAEVRAVYAMANPEVEVTPAVQEEAAQEEAAQEGTVPVKPKRARMTLTERYAAGERARVEKIKADLSPWTESNYEWREIAAEPSTFRKVARLMADKLGIKTKGSEKRREREAIHVALKEYREEEALKDKGLQEQIEREAEERERRETEYNARQEQREREALARDMANARSMLDYNKYNRLRNQRVQELVERDLNARLLKIDDLETEALAENPEVQKRTIEFEGEEIPVYDLKGFPFVALSTTIDYRSANKPGEIGTETYKRVMADPAVWAERRDEAEKEEGFGTRRENARGDVISASYYNSEKNMGSRVSGELVYGFERVEPDSMIMVSNGDGGTINMAGKMETSLTDPDAIKRLEGANGTYMYNEVLLRRYTENGVAKRPDYIIVEDGKITETVLKHAKFFKVPIVNIEQPAYRHKAWERGKELLDSISEDDDYAEMDRKLAELLSISEYKTTYRTLERIGRNYDIPTLLNPTPMQERCLEISKMEQLKRLRRHLRTQRRR